MNSIIIKDKFARNVRLTKERLEHISKRPEMTNQKQKIIKTLKEPNIIRHSKFDKDIQLFYKLFKRTPVTKKYLLVAVKVLDKDAFIITAFFTDKVKKGRLIWQKS